MKIKYLAENQFYKTFLPLIIEVECGQHYDATNSQHVEWLKKRVHALYVNSGMVIALFDGQIPVGFLLLLFDKGLEGVACFGKKATIAMLGIIEQYRSQGYADSLMQEAESFVKNNGGECIYVATYARNLRAIRFYTKSGYIPVAYFHNENGLNDKGQVYFCKELPLTAKN